jgi:two-component system sensor histidine kinase KdpD
LRSALLASIVHDLKTPVTAVLGALSGLRNDFHRFDVRTRTELFDIAQGEAERLERFVSGLLDMTRIETAALEMNPEIVDLADIVGSALRRARRVLGSRVVEVNLASGLPQLPLDVVLFEQVLYNLLDNSAKYSPDKSLVQITGQRCSAEVVLSIIDEGRGIPDDNLERIFDKFYRAPTDGHAQKGTGLGLTICCGFVEALGGAITARNRADRSGSIFTIRLHIEREHTGHQKSDGRAYVRPKCRP